jgi:hypothetical protein
MKYKHLLVPLLIVWLVGCTTSFKPIGGGYYIREVDLISWEPGAGSRQLFYRRSGGSRVLLSGYFMGHVLVKDRTAIFDATTLPGDYVLFASEEGGPRLEVGNAILAFQAEKEKMDVSAFVEQHEVDTSYLKGLTDGIELQYSQRRGVNNPILHIALTWNELSIIMQRVRAEGRPQKDRSGMSYLRIDYNPGVEK